MVSKFEVSKMGFGIFIGLIMVLCVMVWSIFMLVVVGWILIFYLIFVVLFFAGLILMVFGEFLMMFF